MRTVRKQPLPLRCHMLTRRLGCTGACIESALGACGRCVADCDLPPRLVAGNMMKNAHILGFFRWVPLDSAVSLSLSLLLLHQLRRNRLHSRVIRLLTLNIKPVFVFDGATPLLKRQTIMARRARRDQSKTKLRRVAEKVLLNTLQRNAGKQRSAMPTR